MRVRTILEVGCVIFLNAATWPANGAQPNPGAVRQDEPRVVVELTLAEREILTRAPLYLQITVRNVADEAVEVCRTQQGVLLGSTAVVSYQNDPPTEWGQAFLHRDPGAIIRSILAPGESVSGELPLVFGSTPSGFAFDRVGSFTVRIRYANTDGSVRGESNPVLLRARDGSGVNNVFLEDLQNLAIRYFHFDVNTLPRLREDGVHPEAELLSYLMTVTQPRLIAPQERPEDTREVALVESLAHLLENHPNNSYAPYIARFLGLVEIKTFEHEMSLAEAKSWRETGKRPARTTESLVVQPAYEKALRYLTIADEANVWPRTTAALHLGRLYLMSEQWEKAENVATKVRAKYPEVHGQEVADELLREVRGYKVKLAEQRERDSNK